MFKTIEVLVKEYGIKACYIKSAIQQGKLDFYRFGDKTKYIKVSDFERWILSKKNKPSPNEAPVLRMKFLNQEGT